MADNNIDLTATFDTSKATDSIKKFGSEANQAIDGVNKKVDTLSGNISSSSKRKFNIDTSQANSALEGLTSKLKVFGIAAAGYFSAQAIGNFFSTIISESIDAENNLNQLNAALARNGQLTAETSKSMADFADSMMQVSTVDDDVITGQLAIAMNFTKSASQAQELVKAAMNLSSAMKIDLGTAVELLGRTLDGTAGRLNETVPALRGVSAEALKSGEAIRIVNDQFAGAAAAELNTYAGAMSQLSNVIGNFSASLGDMIVKNPMVNQAIKEISNAFTGMTSSVKDGTSASIDFVNRGMIALISGIRDLLPSINALSSFIKSLGFIFDVVIKGIMSFVDSLRILGNSWLWLVGTMEGKKSALTGIEEAMDRMAKRGDELTESLMNIGKDSFSKLDLKNFDDALKRIQDAANKKPIELDTKYKDHLGKITDQVIIEPDLSNLKLPTDIVPKMPEFQGDALTPEQREKGEFMQPFIDFGDWLSNLFADTGDKPKGDKMWEDYITGGIPFDGKKQAEKIGGLFDPGIKAITLAVGEIAFSFVKNAPKIVDSMFSGLSNLIAGMSKGAEGGSAAASQVLGAATEQLGSFVGSIFGPLGASIGGGIGKLVASTLELAKLDPAEAKQKVKEFAESFAQTLATIAENLDVILPKVVEVLPKLIVGIFKALPAVVRALTQSLRPLLREFVKEIPSILQALLDLSWELIRFIFEGSFLAVAGVFDGLKSYLAEKLVPILNGISNFGTEFNNGLTYAKNLISEGLRTISLQNFVNAFNQGLEGAKNFITQSFTAIWDKIVDFGSLFKSLFSNLGNALQSAFEGLFDGSFLNNISNSVTSAFKKIFSFESIAKYVSELAKGFASIFSINNIKRLLSELAYGLGKIFSPENLEKLIQAIIDGFKDLFKAIDPGRIVSNVGGKGQGLIPDKIPIIGGLATGGVVPSGYPDDSYPALLTSSETVIPAQTTPNLFKLIDRLAAGGQTVQTQENSSVRETNDLLRQLISIMASQSTTIDVKLERDTLAKAIVSLNQNNRRLA